MSGAADGLRQLVESAGRTPVYVDESELRIQFTHPDALKLDYALRNAVPELADLIEAAKRAERKLWIEYRRDAEERGYDVNGFREDESWAEGEALEDALAAVEAAFKAEKPA